MAEPFNLDRFVAAQAGPYETVCAELTAGEKRSHWMWSIFPQLAELGRSQTARFYGLSGVPEARAYDRHAVLGPRLQHCAELVLRHPRIPIRQIMGDVDALKLRSCATLFERVAGSPDTFSHLLATFYEGQGCARTEAILGGAA